MIYSGGQLSQRKAQDLVIEAVKIIQKRHPEALLLASWFNIWAGTDGYKDAGVDLLGLPLLSHRELCFYMNQSDVGLFPNRCEGGTNLILMEYMACGKPVVANVSTGQRDVVDDSCSIPIEGSDDELVSQMVGAVERLFHDSQQRKDLGEKARTEMLKWPWSKTVEKFLELI